MKLLIASDIHGSLYFTQKLLKIFEEEQADRLLLLGDFLYHGPRNPLPKDYNPQEVAKLLNQFNDRILAVRGNCDSEVDQMLLEFPILGTYQQVFVDNYCFYLTHGHVISPDNLPQVPGNVVFLSGHTHIPTLYKDENFVIMNPGSISLPKNNFLPSYGIYEDDEWVIKTFDQQVLFSYKK